MQIPCKGQCNTKRRQKGRRMRSRKIVEVGSEYFDTSFVKAKMTVEANLSDVSTALNVCRYRRAVP